MIKDMILHTTKEKLGIKFHPGYTEPLFPARVKVRRLTLHLLVIFFAFSPFRTFYKV